MFDMFQKAMSPLINNTFHHGGTDGRAMHAMDEGRSRNGNGSDNTMEQR